MILVCDGAAEYGMLSDVPTCQHTPKRTAISHIPHQSAMLGGSDYDELCSPYAHPDVHSTVPGV